MLPNPVVEAHRRVRVEPGFETQSFSFALFFVFFCFFVIFGQPISPQIAPFFSFGCQIEPKTTPIELEICVRSILEVLNTLPQKKTRKSQVEPPRAAPKVGHFWRKKGPKCYPNSVRLSPNLHKYCFLLLQTLSGTISEVCAKENVLGRSRTRAISIKRIVP